MYMVASQSAVLLDGPISCQPESLAGALPMEAESGVVIQLDGV